MGVDDKVQCPICFARIRRSAASDSPFHRHVAVCRGKNKIKKGKVPKCRRSGDTSG